MTSSSRVVGSEPDPGLSLAGVACFLGARQPARPQASMQSSTQAAAVGQDPSR